MRRYWGIWTHVVAANTPITTTTNNGSSRSHSATDVHSAYTVHRWAFVECLRWRVTESWRTWKKNWLPHTNAHAYCSRVFAFRCFLFAIPSGYGKEFWQLVDWNDGICLGTRVRVFVCFGNVQPICENCLFPLVNRFLSIHSDFFYLFVRRFRFNVCFGNLSKLSHWGPWIPVMTNQWRY